MGALASGGGLSVLPGLSAVGAGCRWALRVSPGAPVDALDGTHNGRLRVRVAARAVDGAANDALLRFVARELLGLPRSAVTLESGAHARDKQLRIDASVDWVDARLRAAGAVDGP